MATETSRAFTIRRCSIVDAETMATLGARLFAETYGPTHPEPELSRYLARSFAVSDLRDAIADEQVTMPVAEDPVKGAIGNVFSPAKSRDWPCAKPVCWG